MRRGRRRSELHGQIAGSIGRGIRFRRAAQRSSGRGGSVWLSEARAQQAALLELNHELTQRTSRRLALRPHALRYSLWMMKLLESRNALVRLKLPGDGRLVQRSRDRRAERPMATARRATLTLAPPVVLRRRTRATSSLHADAGRALKQ
jgi:hypothetical protein